MLIPSLFLLVSALPSCATTSGSTQDNGASAAPTATIADVFERVSTGVVTLHTVSHAPTAATFGLPVETGGTGSGILITKAGDILTAAHVVQTAEAIEVEFHDGKRVEAYIVASDPLTDLALVRIVGDVPEGVTIGKLGDSDTARIGERVFVVGAPLGISQTLTVGHLSARRIAPSLVDEQDRIEVLQTDASINPGNSGGPLFNMKGEVIGVVSYISTLSGGSQGLGFAVSANTCRERFLKRPPMWSGMVYISVRGRFGEILNVPKGGCGLLVQSVVEGSPADRLGLLGGDISAEIQGLPVLLGGDIVLSCLGVDLADEEARDLIRAKVDSLGSEDQIRMVILRAGRKITLRKRWGDLQ